MSRVIKVNFIKAKWVLSLLFFSQMTWASQCEVTVVKNFAPQTLHFISSTNRLIEVANAEAGRRVKIQGLKVTQTSKENWQTIFQYGRHLLEVIYREAFAGRFRVDNTKLKVKALRERMREPVAEFMHKVVESEKVVVITFDGIDTAGKGVNIKSIRKLMKDIRKNDPLLAALKLKTIKLGKPEEANMTLQQYVDRWISKFPDKKAIVFLDRSFYNRSYVEEALGFTDPARIAEFRQGIFRIEAELEARGIELHKFFFSISLQHLATNILNRIMHEKGQHLLSPVDAKAIVKWNEYVESVLRTFELLKGSNAFAYFVNNTHFFEKGYNPSDSRLVGGWMALSAIIAHSSLTKNKEALLPGAEQIVRVISKEIDNSSTRSFGNEKKHNEGLLEEVDLYISSLRDIVNKAVELGLLKIDPKYAHQDKVDLGVIRETGAE